MVSFTIDGVDYEVVPDDNSAATNRARLIAARDKIVATQAAIETDKDNIDVHLAILDGSPTNAQILAAIKDTMQIVKKNCTRLSGVGDYIIAISNFIEKVLIDD